MSVMCGVGQVVLDNGIADLAMLLHVAASGRLRGGSVAPCRRDHWHSQATGHNYLLEDRGSGFELWLGLLCPVEAGQPLSRRRFPFLLQHACSDGTTIHHRNMA